MSSLTGPRATVTTPLDRTGHSTGTDPQRSSGPLPPSGSRRNSHELDDLKRRTSADRSRAPRGTSPAMSAHSARASIEAPGLAPPTEAERNAALAQVGLARNLRDFGIKLRHQKAQAATQAQLDATAQMINDLRHNPLAEGAAATMSYSELVARCTPEAVSRYKRDVLDLTDEQDRRKTAISKQGGYAIPTSGSIVQAALYAALPTAGLFMSRAWGAYAQVGISAAILFAQPFVTAPLQTMIVSAINVFRQKGAPVTKLAGNIKADDTLPKIEARIQTLAAQAQAETARLNGFMDRMRTAHPGILPSSGEVTQENFNELVQALAPDDLAELKGINDRMTQHSTDTMEALVKGQMLEGMQLRQKDSTRAQEWPRILRALLPGIAGALMPLANHPAISGVDEKGQPNQKIPPWAIVLVSSSLAIAALLAQHYAAGVDEVTAEDSEVKLNMLMGDFFNETGKADWAAGRPVTPAGIDGTKVLAAKGLPESTIAGRVKHFAEAHLATLTAQRDNDAAGRDLEANAPHRHDAEIALETRALAIFDSGNLEELDQPEFAESHTRKLFTEAMKDTSVAFAWREGAAKVPGDFGPQSGQRFGQNFMLGGLGGGAGAVLETRGLTAVMTAVVNKVTDHGGLEAAHPAITSTLGVVGAGAAAVTAAVSAKSQHTAVTAKNIRRDNPESGVSWAGQVWNGIKGPFFQSQQDQAGQALRPAGDAVLGDTWKGQAANLRAAVEANQPEVPEVLEEAEDVPGPVNRHIGADGRVEDADAINRG
jgi:hypothetical protein